MKWFEHRTTDRNELEVKLIKRKFGIEGYGIWCSLLEIIAENMESDNISEWGFVNKKWTMTMLAEEIGCPLEVFKKFVVYCDEVMIFEKRNGRLFCQFVMDRMNEYAKKVLKKEKSGLSEKTDFPKKLRNNTTQSQHNHNTTQSQTKDILSAEPKVSPKREISPGERLPTEKQTALHRIGYYLEDLLHTKIVSWPKQAKALKLMTNAGYREEQILWTITQMEREEFYQDKGFDLMTVANNIASYKAKFRKENYATAPT